MSRNFLRGRFYILFGILAYVWPGATVLAIIWIIGIYAIVTGGIGIVLSFKVKGARPMTLVAT